MFNYIDKLLASIRLLPVCLHSIVSKKNLYVNIKRINYWLIKRNFHSFGSRFELCRPNKTVCRRSTYLHSDRIQPYTAYISNLTHNCYLKHKSNN